MERTASQLVMAQTERKKSIPKRIRTRWRAWLRALHRDLGFLAIGLTFVYALSGIAINHIGQWDPNFKSVVESSHLDAPFSKNDEVLGARIDRQLGAQEDDVQAAFYDTETLFEVSLADGVAQLDINTGAMKYVSKEPRFMLRAANWLHYNRGKSAWTYIADAYAIILLYLAFSGLIMLRGRKGLFGRGGILLIVGIAIPIAYVHFSSGP